MIISPKIFIMFSIPMSVCLLSQHLWARKLSRGKVVERSIIEQKFWWVEVFSTQKMIKASVVNAKDGCWLPIHCSKILWSMWNANDFENCRQEIVKNAMWGASVGAFQQNNLVWTIVNKQDYGWKDSSALHKTIQFGI